MSGPISLDLRLLSDQPNIGRIDGEYMAAGASFILEHNHGPALADRLTFDDGTVVRPGEILRSNIDDNVRRFRRDLNKATEAGAEAVGLLVVMQAVGRRVVHRLPTETGADFLLEPVLPDAGFEFERVEFGGVGYGKESTNARMGRKLRQMRKYGHERPGHAVVTNFTTMPIEVAMRRAS